MASNKEQSKKLDITSGPSESYKQRIKEVKKLHDEDRKMTKEDQKLYETEQMRLIVEEHEAERKAKLEVDNEASEIRKKYYQQEGKIFNAIIEESFGTAQKTVDTLINATSNITSDLTEELDTVINKYVGMQQSMTAHLVGSASLTSITDTLNSALSSTSLVKQETVYKNLSQLLSKGIVYNVEQRAFLATITDDLGMAFKADSDSMNRLIRIIGSDITSSRVAMEYTLQEYLNSNYQTSEYIQDAMSDVSDAILSSQSLMSTSDALSYESVIQDWLGAYYSSGISKATVTGIAEALDKLSTGDISNIGQGLSNLVLMGVARAGLDYGSLMNNNLTASDVNSIMEGITSYVASMSDYSNVSKSQLASLFGIDVSDIAAIANYKGSGGASTNISELFSDYDNLVPDTVQVENLLSNMMYSWGTNIASSSLALLSYKAEELIADNLGKALSGINVEVGFLGNGVEVNLGKVAEMAPLITLLPTLAETIGQAMTNLSNITSGDLSSVYNLLGSTTVSSNGTTTASLGSTTVSSNGTTTAPLGSTTVSSNGTTTASYTSGTTISTSGSGVSGSMYMSNGNADDILSNSLNSISSTVGMQSITGDEKTTSELIEMVNDSVLEIYDLLADRFDMRLSDIDFTTTTNVTNYNASVF